MASIEDGAEPVTHSGPPSVNVEVLLRGDEVDSGDAGNDPEGEVSYCALLTFNIRRTVLLTQNLAHCFC